MNRILKISKLLVPLFLLSLTSCTSNSGNSGDEQKQLSSKAEKRAVYERDESSYRIVSYNVGTFSKYMTNSTSMVADMMKEIEADAMILNELDKNNNRHNTDQLADFASYMDWNFYYAPAMKWNGGEYGNGAAYSKELKVLDKYVIALPKVTGSEDRSCVVIEFEDFVLAGTHLEVASETDRVKGVQTITERLTEKYGGGTKPVFICGDMNAEPSSETILEFEKDCKQLTPTKGTFPSSGGKNCIDFIFALNNTGAYAVTAADVLTSFKSGDVTKTSDHLPIYIDVTITKE